MSDHLSPHRRYGIVAGRPDILGDRGIHAVDRGRHAVRRGGQSAASRTRSARQSRVVGEDELLVPGSRRLEGELRPLYHQFDLRAIQPFDLRYLTNWAAETFQVSAADASLDARKQAIARLRDEIEVAEVDEKIDSFQIHTANMLVASYRLVLLPVWLSSYCWMSAAMSC